MLWTRTPSTVSAAIVSVDPPDDRGEIELVDHALSDRDQIEAIHDLLDVDAGGDRIDVQPVDDGCHVHTAHDLVDVDARDHGAKVDPFEDEVGQIEPINHRIDQLRNHRVREQVRGTHALVPFGVPGLVPAGGHLLQTPSRSVDRRDHGHDRERPDRSFEIRSDPHEAPARLERDVQSGADDHRGGVRGGRFRCRSLDRSLPVRPTAGRDRVAADSQDRRHDPVHRERRETDGNEQATFEDAA